MLYFVPFQDLESKLVNKTKSIELPLIRLNENGRRGVMLEAIIFRDKIIGILFIEASNTSLIELKKYKILNEELKERYLQIIDKYEHVGTLNEFKMLLDSIKDEISY